MGQHFACTENKRLSGYYNVYPSILKIELDFSFLYYYSNYLENLSYSTVTSDLESPGIESL